MPRSGHFYGRALAGLPRIVAPTWTPVRKPTPTRRTCQAHLVAITAAGALVLLSDGPCSDSARGEPISLLLEDADRSAASELGRSRPRYTFEGCPTHRNAYVASRSTRAGSRVGCPRAKAHVREGIPLCDERLRPTVTWHDEIPAVAHARPRFPSLGGIAPAAPVPESPGRANPYAWIRWNEPSQLAAQASSPSGSS